MKAMILAAGRGERMRPLTDHTPKPLLEVGGQPLIVWHLEALARAGIRDVVINHAWLGAQIEARLGDGSAFGVTITYSPEGASGLETAGGIAHALPLLGQAPFLVINGDTFHDYPLADLAARAARWPDAPRGHLVLVPKPDYPTGADLALREDGQVVRHTLGLEPRTFAGIAAYTPAFFSGVDPDRPSPLLPRFDAAMAEGRLTGEVYTGRWFDVGTVERLALADAAARAGALRSAHTSGKAM